jgi:ABC-type dipeptide/oligopeptide/nickel transport system permease subunit
MTARASTEARQAPAAALGRRANLGFLVRFIRNDPLGGAAAIVVLVVAICAVFAATVHTSDPQGISHDILKGEFSMAFPPIIMGMVVATALQPGLRSVIISVGIIVIAVTARVIRAAVLQERELAYVDGARAIGASGPRIVFRHLLPNTLPLAVVLATSLLPSAILFESGLTFLGFGLPPGEPSWGGDLTGSTRILFQTAPWLAIFPGAALSITILALNLLGDSIRDALDPRRRTGSL